MVAMSFDADIVLMTHPTVTSAIIVDVTNAILFLNVIQTPPYT